MQLRYLARWVTTRRKRPHGLVGLLLALGACQANSSNEAAVPLPLPTGHFAGGLQVPGQPELRVALELRHPRPGHYDAELVLPQQPTLSFVADTLTLTGDTLRLARPGRPGEALTLGRQGDFWRGTLRLDSVSYPLLLVRRGPPEPTVYRVRRDEVAGTNGPALLFSPADESLPGPALALFPTAATAPTAPAWADALARNGYAVLLLPAADSLPAGALTAALTYLHRVPGVDTVRVGAWAAGPRAAQLVTLLAAPATAPPPPAFILAEAAPLPDAATRLAWRSVGRRIRVLGVYDAVTSPTPQAATNLQQALGGRRRVVRATGSALTTSVLNWLREL